MTGAFSFNPDLDASAGATIARVTRTASGPPELGLAQLLRVHFLGTGSGGLDHFVPQGSGWRLAAGVSRQRPGNHPLPASLFLFETTSPKLSGPQLAEMTASISSGKYVAGSIALRNHSAARRLARTLAKLDGWRATVWGVDPDYFFALVPLRRAGHKGIESFVQRLKPSRSARDRLRRVINLTLILVGLNLHLYESFLVILEGPECS